MGAESSKGGACCVAPAHKQDKRIKTHAFPAAELEEMNAGGVGGGVLTASAVQLLSPAATREILAGLDLHDEAGQPAAEDEQFLTLGDVEVRTRTSLFAFKISVYSHVDTNAERRASAAPTRGPGPAYVAPQQGESRGGTARRCVTRPAHAPGAFRVILSFLSF